METDEITVHHVSHVPNCNITLDTSNIYNIYIYIYIRDFLLHKIVLKLPMETDEITVHHVSNIPIRTYIL